MDTRDGEKEHVERMGQMAELRSSLLPGTAPLSASQHCTVWEVYCPSRLGGWEAAGHLPCLHQPGTHGFCEQNHGELLSGYGAALHAIENESADTVNNSMSMKSKF